MTTPRNRSIKFEDHQALIHRDARRYYNRILGARIMGIDYDDVFGELCLAFVPAARGYDPESQWTFTAYLGICMRNHFNKLAKKLMLEQYGTERQVEGVNTWGVGYISVEDMRDEDVSIGDGFDMFADENSLSPEQAYSNLSEIESVINDSTLSPETRVYVSLLLDPAMELSERVKKRLHKASSTIRSELDTRYGVKLRVIVT